MAPSERSELLALGPVAQLRAGALPRRLAQLFAGLSLFGISVGLMVRAGLGLPPWDVLHAGIASRTGIRIGTVAILVGAAVLVAWWPLRQWPGLGTVANAIWVGVAMNLTLDLVPDAAGWIGQVTMLVAGIVLNGIAGGMYIGSQFGPGPRDGLMTGLHRRTGWTLRSIRAALEIFVLVAGWLLGGRVGLGTFLYAFGIGPLVQFFLRHLVVKLPVGSDHPRLSDTRS